MTTDLYAPAPPPFKLSKRQRNFIKSPKIYVKDTSVPLDHRKALKVWALSEPVKTIFTSLDPTPAQKKSASTTSGLTRAVRLYHRLCEVNVVVLNQLKHERKITWLHDRQQYVVTNDPRVLIREMHIHNADIKHYDQTLYVQHTAEYKRYFNIGTFHKVTSGAITDHVVKIYNPGDGSQKRLLSRIEFSNHSQGRHFKCPGCEKCYDEADSALHHTTRLCNACIAVPAIRMRFDIEAVQPGDIVSGDFHTAMMRHHYYGHDPISMFGFNSDTVRFSGVTGQPRFFGVELELECGRYVQKRDLTELAKSHWGFTSDGSLRQGIEFRSCPAGINTHRLEFKRMIEASFVGPKMVTSERCGMHVHVSRASLTELTAYRLNKFFAAPGNQKFLTTVAGRAPNRWCSRQILKDPRAKNVKLNYNSARPSSWDPKTKKVITKPGYKKIIDGLGKYHAVNMGHSNTIEFRCFSATKDPIEFNSRIQFCDAIIEYLSLNNNLSYEEFLNWYNSVFKCHSTMWPELTTFLCETKKFIKRPEKPKRLKATKPKSTRGTGSRLISALLKKPKKITTLKPTTTIEMETENYVFNRA